TSSVKCLTRIFKKSTIERKFLTGLMPVHKPNYGRAAAGPHPVHRGTHRTRPPYWLPAQGYYVLAAAVSLAIFFILWGVMNDGAERTPWIPAGLAASIVLAGAVIFREIVLRAARDRFHQEQRRLEHNLR